MSKFILKFRFNNILQKLCLLKGQHIYALSVLLMGYKDRCDRAAFKRRGKRGTHRPARKKNIVLDHAVYAAVRSGIHNIIIGSQIETNREQ